MDLRRVKSALKPLRRASNALRSLGSPFLREYPAGHFYSPLPGSDDLRRRENDGGTNPSCLGVDLDEARQLRILGELRQYYADLPFSDQPTEPGRYYYQNDYFRHGDAIVLYGMMRRLRPKRVVEVGSGFSSAVMLETNERFLSSETHLTFIEPFSERLEWFLPHAKRTTVDVIRLPVQDVALSVFDELGPRDILFIDSSHVVKVGSDVKFLLDEVVPRVAPGVSVHFHDVGWPFEYPIRWNRMGRAWNEAYYLRSFLQFNSAFGIDFFNAYMAAVHADVMRDGMPMFMWNSGASLWLRRDR